MSVAVLIASIVVQLVLLARHLKIAQLEHYVPGSVTRTVLRWYAVLPWNVAGFVVTLGLIVAGSVDATTDDWPPVLAVVAILGVVLLLAMPAPLSMRGLELKATFTRRLRVVALVSLLVAAVLTFVLLIPFGITPAAVWLPAALSPLVVDAALWALRPVEDQLAGKYAKAAADALKRVGPRVVAITGSYGKTTTKEILATLLTGVTSCVASPASFNNRAGLSRAVSERLEPGTDIFVAEMGTYGPGEIFDLCLYFPPDVSVITAIGPVHLERMRTIGRIVEAKSEIIRDGAPVVLNVDSPELAELADRTAQAGQSPVIRVGTAGDGLDVRVTAVDGGFDIEAAGTTHHVDHPAAASLDASNLACVLGAVVALGLDLPATLRNVARIERPKNRRTAGTAPAGFTVIDDTFNSNPAGARRAVDELARLGADGKKVLVSPGMVELGPKQSAENERWIAESDGAVDELIVVGHTNRKALLSGARRAGLATRTVARREIATTALRGELGSGDAVLYENDLPIHYP